MILAGLIARWQAIVWATAWPPYILPGPAAAGRRLGLLISKRTATEGGGGWYGPRELTLGPAPESGAGRAQ